VQPSATMTSLFGVTFGLTKGLKMRRQQALVFTAWLVHVVAWFLPVVKGGVTLPQGLPGWQAFRVAACAVWPYEGLTTDYAVLCVISAATTLVFIPGSVWVVLSGSHALRRASALVAISAFVVNAHWYVLFGSDRKDLRIGYFLWWFSFLLMALGLLVLSPREAHKSNSRNNSAERASAW
jgi:hypothetical protein